MEKNVKEIVINGVAIVNKGKLNKERMASYVFNKGTLEDKAWFISLCKENTVECVNNVRGGTYTSINHDVVREEFCLRFDEFYHLSDKAKREARKDTTFQDLLAEMERELEKMEVKIAC